MDYDTELKVPSMKFIFSIVMLFACLFALNPPAYAKMKIPNYDIKEYCKEIGDVSGGSSMIELTCRKEEQKAKEAISKMDFDDRILGYCTEVTDAGGQSYMILQECIREEIHSKQQLAD